ncbi:MAG: hypothetical protein P8N17_01740 [Luminiphilus sp.]|nr:hypothetical protein [Luminiphilus sp.]
MKKNLLALAVATSVAGAASVAVQATTVSQYVSANKTGEVIMFPFYNADNGNATNMHIVNTTGAVKAMKVRFVEYKNSDEVLDFNLYLSPNDHFAFGVIKDPNGNGAAVITGDNSCTVPALGSANGAFSGTTTANADGSTTRIQPFVNYQYANSKDVDSSIERTLTGHVEVIEMGVVTDEAGDSVKAGTALAASATHGPTGVPASCANLEAAWSAGTWKASAVARMSAPEGGVYGLAYHINVEDAAAFGFEPTAIGDWANGVNHTNPGSVLPSLGVDGKTSGLVHVGGGLMLPTGTYASSFEATTAILATTSISNDVMVNPALGGETDWVVTFPTKRFHVDTVGQGNAAVVAPFSATGGWLGAKAKGSTFVEQPACEVVSVAQYDREEAVTAPTNGFSPSPAQASLSICNEVAVIAMGTGSGSALSVETGLSNLSFPYSEGWMEISFPTQTATAGVGVNATVDGLPAIGFAAYKVNNGAMSYGNAAEHKTANAVSGIAALD